MFHGCHGFGVMRSSRATRRLLHAGLTMFSRVLKEIVGGRSDKLLGGES